MNDPLWSYTNELKLLSQKYKGWEEVYCELKNKIEPLEKEVSRLKERVRQLERYELLWKKISEWVGENVEGVETCEDCGSIEDLVYGPDPFGQEVKGDTSRRWLCRDCHESSAMEI